MFYEASYAKKLLAGLSYQAFQADSILRQQLEIRSEDYSFRAFPSKLIFDFEVIHFCGSSFKVESRAGDVLRSVEFYSLSFKAEL